jgi:hypothetical protein
MKNYLNNLLKCLLAAVALAALCPAPALAQIDVSGIGLRNDLGIPIQVQGASNINGTLRRGPLIVVLPNRTGFDANLLPGLRQITIYDANVPNRILFQGTVNYQGADLLYSVRPAPQPSRYPATLFRLR